MKVRVIAPAKINWTLEILRRREDGYHEVRTILQTIALWDVLHLEPAQDLSLEYEGTAPVTTDNDLALKAARLLQQAAGVGHGARLRLRKEIPAPGGLGGGSSDAAAVLRGLHQLWKLDMSPNDLARLGADLGSDVPFFIYGGTALGIGRGEKIIPMPDAPVTWLVIVAPNIQLPAKTATMYSSLTGEDYMDGSAGNKLAAGIRRRSAPRDDLLANGFERAALSHFPQLAEMRNRLAAVARRPVHLAGSGPALFTLASSQTEAQEIAMRAAQQIKARIIATCTLGSQSATDVDIGE